MFFYLAYIYLYNAVDTIKIQAIVLNLVYVISVPFVFETWFDHLNTIDWILAYIS
jgi:hypothetical protein